MDYSSPAEVFEEFANLTENYQGLDYPKLNGGGKIWPYRTDHTEPGYIGDVVLFQDVFPTATGRGKFVPAEYTEAKDLPDEEFPLVLNTGRVLEHWHTGTMTRRAKVLDALSPEPFVEVNPADLARFGISDGETVTLQSRRGAIVLAARAESNVQPGSVFVPFHFREASANALTNDALDPFGKIPEFKFCAVRILKTQTA
jgi:formate dehydrogenase major subunit